MDSDERLERFQELLQELVEANEDAAVLVEGRRDQAALKELGLAGEILVYNQGETMADFAEGLRPRKQIIVLFDWDRKGGQLARLFQQKIAGGVRLDLEFRRRLARLSLVRCVEDLPSALRTIAKRAATRTGSSQA